MSKKCYLRLDGIRGASKAAHHQGEIDILNYSWGIPAPGNLMAMGMGAAPGRSNVSEITVFKNLDVTSHLMMPYYANGRMVRNGKLTVETILPGGKFKPFLTASMENIMIVHISSGSGMEQVTLNFGKFNLVYN